jgi:S-DNA-T family DNA segregation ATPase FtsK/SpoIIIE
VSSDDEHQELDVHYVHALDDEPEPTRGPVYVDVVEGPDSDRRPIIPAALRKGNRAGTARRYGGNAAHRAGYHGVRLPRYVPLAGFWALVGLFRLVGRQLRWWWVMEQHSLRQAAADSNDPDTWFRLHAHAKATRLWRGIVLGCEAVALIIAVSVLIRRAPWWLDALVALAVVPPLAHLGRPVDRPIVSPAIVTPRFRLLTADIVLRALYAAGLGRADKDDQVIKFGSVMARDGEGSRVLVDLPYGKTFEDALTVRGKIASGLDVTVQQVFLTRDKTSQRRIGMWVADRDPLAIPAGRTPLLDCKPRDIWQPAPLGLDERGQLVAMLLLWISVLVGAQPRKGKTFTARLLALYAALDPYVRLTVIDGKNSPDWKMFRLIAHRIVMGTAPNPFSSAPVEQVLDALREIKRHIEGVNAFLSTLPASVCPEGKVTRDLSRQHPQLRVWMLVVEEFQVYFELDDQDTNKEIAGLLSFIMAVGPSAGVILLSSSQKPSGVGAGDVARLFNRFRDNHAVRFALKCGNRVVSEAVLGGDAYSEGFDASALPIGPEYRGVGYLYGLTDHTPTVRCHLADQQDAERIVAAARRYREAAGTLTGHAAGEDMTREARDLLADVDSVFYAGEAWISWEKLAARLREQLPEQYADVTKESVSSQVRALGAEAKKGRDETGTPWGVPREHVRLAIQRREIEGKR